jgi:invasion protein IalB
MRSHRLLNTAGKALVGLGVVLVLAPHAVVAEPTQQDYKDWTVRCQEPDKGGRCVMSQLLKNRDNDEPLMLVEIGYLKDGPEPMAQFVVPLGVFLPAGMLLRVDDAEQTGRLPYTVCDKVGCKAIAKLDDKVLGAMKKGKEMFTTLTSPTGDTATMSISLAGFTAALDALK